MALVIALTFMKYPITPWWDMQKNVVLDFSQQFPNGIFNFGSLCIKEMKLSKSMEFPWRKSQMMRFNLLWEQFARIWSSAHEVIPQGIMKWLKCEIMVCSISHLASLKIIYFPTWHSCKAKLYFLGFSRWTRSENSKSIFSWCQFFQKTSNKIYLGLP